jgi:transposase-like protein
LRKLRDADALLGRGVSSAEVGWKLEVSEPTYHRWRHQYGGMQGEEMKRPTELEEENAQLKRLVAEQALDNRKLKDLAEGIP